MTTRRRVRRGNILPGAFRSARERRELVISHAIVLALQLAIAAALVVSALQTYSMWRQGVPYIPGEIARTVPVFLLLGAMMALFVASRSLRRLRTLQRTPVDATPDDPA